MMLGFLNGRLYIERKKNAEREKSGPAIKPKLFVESLPKENFIKVWKSGSIWEIPFQGLLWVDWRKCGEFQPSSPSLNICIFGAGKSFRCMEKHIYIYICVCACVRFGLACLVVWLPLIIIWRYIWNDWTPPPLIYPESDSFRSLSYMSLENLKRSEFAFEFTLLHV